MNKSHKDSKKYKHFKLCFFIALLCPLFISCIKKTPSRENLQEVIFFSRDNGVFPFYKQKIYTAKAPIDWVLENPLETSSIYDTTIPTAIFWIKNEKQDQLRLTFHTFPYQSEDERISPQAQLFRWINSFQSSLTFNQTTPQSFAGFVGFRLEAIGIQNEKETHLLGWSMQLAKEHERRLSQKQAPFFQAMRADWTVKVVGSPELIQEKREQIVSFVRTIRLIAPIPL